MSYAVYFAVVASLASLFEVAYPFLDGTRIGLCYLAIGGIMTLGTSFVGKYLDLRYKQEEKRLREILTTAGDLENRLLVEGVNDVGKLPEFPIERVCPFILLFRVGITNPAIGSTQVPCGNGRNFIRCCYGLWLVYRATSSFSSTPYSSIDQ